MEPSYKILDQSEDVLFMAKGSTLAELFEQCGLAFQQTQAERELIQAREKVKILGEDRNVENLLLDFMDELFFFRDYKQMIFRNFQISIEKREGKYQLSCIAAGEKLDPLRHEKQKDVKGIEAFKVQSAEEGWKAQMLLKRT
ncbi:hypothetical protein COV20_01915 [Candidatus Woesearchaeota archaeon CG10_big_fil_rev_8_21_14_0_10_45_16]|nr:MAG: hypothetical protein COV20_01915 [Candidatus Woesearchaeota archaeon CG10_big_fil_rev_8_21_14_0_10_45_16]